MKCLSCNNETKKSYRKYCSRACIVKDRIFGNRPWICSGHFKQEMYRKKHIPKERWPKSYEEERHCVKCGIIIIRPKRESKLDHNKRKYCSRNCFGKDARGL